MLTSMCVEVCHECSRRMIDAGEELVCTSCGGVARKEVLESHEDREPQAIDYTEHALGSYLGPLEYGYGEIFSEGFSKSSSTFRYLKTISDHSGRESTAVYTCARMIERICEKLLVPKTVIGQAISIAKSALQKRKQGNEFNTASISAFSIITACKIYGIKNVGVREIIEVHTALGHRVKTSTLIEMSIESPIRAGPRRAEEYLSRVVARLPSNLGLRASLREHGINEVAYYHRLLEAAKRILEMIDGSARGGHSPCALAASSIYAAEIALSRMESRRKFMTQKDVARCVDIAEYTVREQYGEIFRPRADDIVDTVIRTAQQERPASTQTPPQHLLLSSATR